MALRRSQPQLTLSPCFYPLSPPRVRLFTLPHSFSNSFLLPLPYVRFFYPALLVFGLAFILSHLRTYNILSRFTRFRPCFYSSSPPRLPLFISAHSFTTLFLSSLTRACEFSSQIMFYLTRFYSHLTLVRHFTLPCSFLNLLLPPHPRACNFSPDFHK